jgi:O-antigen/teichoic acid export membrane protein
MSLKQKAVSGVKWTAVSTIFSTFFQVVRIVVLGRLLAPEDFGLMAMMVVVTGFAGIFGEMGLGSAIIQRPNPTKNELSSLYWANVFFGFIVYGFLFAITPFVAALYSTPELKTMLPIASLTFLFIPWGNQFRALLQKELLFKKLSCIEIISSGLGTTTAVILAVSGWGVWALVYAQLMESGFRTMWLCWIGWRWPTKPGLHFAYQDMKGYLGFGLNQVGAMSINYFNSRTDQLVIGALLGPEALGFYSMAFNLVMMPVQKINPILTRVAFPVFAQVQHDRARLKRGYLKMLNILTTVNAPVLMGFAAVAPMAVPLILGEKWTPIVHVVQVLCFYSLIRSTGNPGGSLVMAIGRSDIEFYWNLGLLFIVPATVYSSGLIGQSIESISWALVGVQLLLLNLWYFLVVKRIFGSIFTEYFATMLKPAIISFAMFVCIYYMISFFSVSFVFLGAAVLLGGALFLVMEILFDRKNVKSILEFVR